MKAALFAFNGDPMCFVHVLLTAIDMHEKEHTVTIVIEGSATKLVPALCEADNPLYTLFNKAGKLGLIAGACKACSKKTGAIEAIQAEGIKLLDDMHGHPGMARYRENGFDIITF